ncbi:MAG: hypothetical protein R3324_04980, partial [Halobacteriales archaeon]|nr:hypothetical protein [Halobacteriales archaeon]
MSTQLPPEQRDQDLEVVAQPEAGLELIHRGASHLAAAGLFTAGAGAALVLVADLAAAPFVLPPLLIAVVVGTLAWRFGRWSKALAILAGVLFILMVGPHAFANGLMRFDSFFDLVPNTMALLGAVVAIGAGAAALV